MQYKYLRYNRSGRRYSGNVRRAYGYRKRARGPVSRRSVSHGGSCGSGEKRVAPTGAPGWDTRERGGWEEDVREESRSDGGIREERIPDDDISDDGTQDDFLDDAWDDDIPTDSIQDIDILDLDDDTPEDGEREDGVPTVREAEAERQESSGKKRRWGRWIALVASLTVVLAGLAYGGYVYYGLPERCVRKVVQVEAGGICPSVADFLEWENEKAYVVSGLSEDIDLSHVGVYEVVIHLYHQDVTAMLQVVDTVPPEVETRDKVIMLGEEYGLDDFLVDVRDITDCEVSWQEESEITRGGSYTVTVRAVDEGGNVTEKNATLEVLQDVTPPTIEGIEEMTTEQGESVSYRKNITVTDDFDDKPVLEIEHENVDFDTPGDFLVTYRATDKYGNVAEAVTTLHINAPPEPEPEPEPVVVAPPVPDVPVTEEAVIARADEILASILTPEMSQYDVIKAIFDWCHGIKYRDGTPKGYWVDGAYAGLVKKSGDCYAYAMSAKCLLDRAGITNMIIERVRHGNGMHFWNLVDIGEGWHHFDTCRRADGFSFFYLTDGELMEYSNAHTARDYPNGSHYYDRTLYPDIP